MIEGALAAFSLQPRLCFYASYFSWGKSNQYFWVCKAVENDSQALCESVCVAVKELWTELNFSTKYFLCMSYRVAFLKAGKLQPAWSWLFLWPQQGPPARSIPTPAPVPAPAALSRWELQMLGSVSIPCGCCLLNSHSKFSSLKTGASVFLSLSQVWREG